MTQLRSVPGFAGRVQPPRLLSPREQEALRLYCELETYKAVAHEMGVTLPTVRAFLQNAYHKLGVTTSLGALKALGWLRYPARARVMNG